MWLIKGRVEAISHIFRRSHVDNTDKADVLAPACMEAHHVVVT